jgi:hypothetical protein
MKVFVDFYIHSTGWNGEDFSGPVKLIRRLGSDGYAPLDARLSLTNLHHAAQSVARQRLHCVAYQLMRGDLRTNQPISQLVTL